MLLKFSKMLTQKSLYNVYIHQPHLQVQAPRLTPLLPPPSLQGGWATGPTCLDARREQRLRSEAECDSAVRPSGVWRSLDRESSVPPNRHPCRIIGILFEAAHTIIKGL